MSADMVQLLFFMILPVFIVFMAPLGIYVALGLYKHEPIKRQKRLKARAAPEERDWYNLIKTWIKFNWMAVRINNYFHILKEEQFFSMVVQRKITFPKSAYNKILKAAKKTGCIGEDENILISDEKEVLTLISKYLNIELKEVPNGTEN